MTQRDTTRAIAILENLPIVGDSGCDARAMHQTLALARTHNLTTYDAAYLDLAMQTGLPLATLDNQLIQVSESLGVTVL